MSEGATTGFLASCTGDSSSSSSSSLSGSISSVSTMSSNESCKFSLLSCFLYRLSNYCLSWLASFYPTDLGSSPADASLLSCSLSISSKLKPPGPELGLPKKGLNKTFSKASFRLNDLSSDSLSVVLDCLKWSQFRRT